MRAMRPISAGSTAPGPTPASTRSIATCSAVAARDRRSSSRATAGTRRATTAAVARCRTHVSYRRPVARDRAARRGPHGSLGLKRGDRIAFNLPNILEQIYYTEAAKRLGIIYTPCLAASRPRPCRTAFTTPAPGSWSPPTAAIAMPRWSPTRRAYTDQALDNFMPLPSALACLDRVLRALRTRPAAERLSRGGRAGLKRRDHHRAQRPDARARRRPRGRRRISAERSAELRTTVARELAGVAAHGRTGRGGALHGPGHRVQPRDRWSHDLVSGPRTGFWIMPALPASWWRMSTLLADWTIARCGSALNAVHPALPVDPDWPLFIIYTSGSTGKPKGVVHTHGGWLPASRTACAWSLTPAIDDRIYVVGDPGWITGQSYLIAAPLARGHVHDHQPRARRCSRTRDASPRSSSATAPRSSRPDPRSSRP
jgi:acrylyl-CoA reductase (NADPH)/3-hydroxypropionyl-CoA dehydratase/3-hydroxypropionyl-CoA synthetase